MDPTKDHTKLTSTEIQIGTSPATPLVGKGGDG